MYCIGMGYGEGSSRSESMPVRQLRVLQSASVGVGADIQDIQSVKRNGGKAMKAIKHYGANAVEVDGILVL